MSDVMHQSICGILSIILLILLGVIWPGSVMQMQFDMPDKDSNFPTNYLLLRIPRKLAIANVRSDAGAIEKLVIHRL